MNYPFGLRVLASGLKICQGCTCKALRDICPNCDLDEIDYLEIYVFAQEYLAFENIKAGKLDVLTIAATRYFNLTQSVQAYRLGI